MKVKGLHSFKGDREKQCSIYTLFSTFDVTDSIAYNKMYAALTKKRLLAGIMQASPLDQTSCLEGFHSVLNQFSPKMISYSFPGMFCRYKYLYINPFLPRGQMVYPQASTSKVIIRPFQSGIIYREEKLNKVKLFYFMFQTCPGNYSLQQQLKKRCEENQWEGPN